MAALMRALVFNGPRTLAVVDVPTPRCGPDEVLVRLHGCGICGSNLPVWEGRPWFSYPMPPGAPGHEGWGTIERVGHAVDGMVEGEKVAVLSARAFAGFDVASPANLVRLPPSLAASGFPAEPVACAVNVMRRSQVRSGDSVAIVGVGFLGALLIQLARQAGAVVTAIGRREYSLEVAARCGAVHVVQMSARGDLFSEAMRSNGGVPFDRVIEVAGTQATLDIAAALVRERGTLIIAGYHQDGRRTIDLQSWNWRGIDVVNAHERDPATYVAGMHEAVRLAASGTIQVAPLMTHTYPLEDADQAFELAVTRPRGFMKSLVRCDG